VLAVNGGFDLRTPVANAVAVISQFPKGQLVTVPGVGHSVSTADFSNCAPNVFRSWILGTLNAFKQASCPRVPPLGKVLSRFPARPAKKTAAATLAAAARTVREAEASWLQIIFSSATFTPRGLYGGKLVVGKGLGFTLTRYSVAPGVLVTGKITFVNVGPPITYKGTVKISGSAAVAGTLTFSKNAVSGRLGGRPVKGSY
jgi:hypothetical protein